MKSCSMRSAVTRAVYYHYECSNPSCHDAVVLDVRTTVFWGLPVSFENKKIPRAALFAAPVISALVANCGRTTGARIARKSR